VSTVPVAAPVTVSPDFDSAPAPAGSKHVRWSPALWGALFVLCGALFLDGLDVSMVGVALPSIQADLGLSTSSLQWVVSGYILGYGGLLLLGGRAADLLGRRQVFLIAIAVFAVASLLGGLVDDGTLLIATRFVKGLSAAFTAPAGLSIITTTFPEGPQRNRALSIYTLFGASGFSMGLVLGGLMTQIGWRWTFLLPAPIALIVFLAGLKLIPNHGRPEQRGGYDVGGAVTASAAMLLLVYTVVQAPYTGWLTFRTLGQLAVVVGLLAAFGWIEHRSAHPLVRVGIFRHGPLLRANLIAIVGLGSYVSFQFITALYLQNLLHWSPLKMALALLPGGLVVLAGSQFVDKIIDRFGSAPVIAAGMTAFLLGYVWFLRLGPEPEYASLLLPTMLLIGVGFGLSFPALNVQATNGVVDEEQGMAAGILQTAFQVGGAVILAVVTAVVVAANAPAGNPAATLASYRPALGVVVGVAAVAALIGLSGLLRRRQRQLA
jgi:MFS family permease